MIRYAITDRNALLPEYAFNGPFGDRERQAQLARRCRVLAEAGVDFIQLREKDLRGAELIALGRAVLAAIRVDGRHTRLLLNVSHADDARAALSIGADGVHLTSQAQVSAGAAGELYREHGLAAPYVSVSCHTLDEVERARQAGVSAILFGPVFGKTVNGAKVVAGVGLDLLGEACRVAGDVPVLALGGVTDTNAVDCVKAGAAGIAAIRLFMTGPLVSRS